MPSMSFATGLLNGYFTHQASERSRKEKNALDAATFLLNTGRVRDFNDLLPILDQGTGGTGTGKKPQGFLGGVKAGAKGQDSNSVLSALINPILQMSRNTGAPGGTGTTGTPGTGGSTGSPEPGTQGNAPTSAIPGKGPLMSDEEVAQAEARTAVTKDEALQTARIARADRLAKTFEAKGFSPEEATTAAYDAVGLKMPARRADTVKTAGKPIAGGGLPQNAVDLEGNSIPPDQRGDGTFWQPLTVSGPGGAETRYTAAAAPPESKLPAKLQEAVDEELAAQGIDPRKATEPQKVAALSGAGKRLRDKGALDAEAERALIAMRTLAGKGGALGQIGAVGPKGEELPQVSLGADGRPVAADQEAFLGHFDRGTQTAIKGIADYSINPTNFSNRTTSTRGGGLTRAQIVELVKQFDPSYDDKLYGQRNKTQTDWTSGKTRDSMVATNTVVRHLSELDEATKALAPYTWSTYSAINEKKLKTQAGFNKPVRDAIKRFETARQAVASELERVYRGTGGSQGDINEWRNNLSPYDATDAKQTALKTAVSLMFGRINSAVDGYRASMGKNPPIGLGLSPASMRVLRRMGIDPTGLTEAGQVPEQTPETPETPETPAPPPQAPAATGGTPANPFR